MSLNSEARMTNDERMTKPEAQTRWDKPPASQAAGNRIIVGTAIRHLDFGLLSPFVIRHSDFETGPRRRNFTWMAVALIAVGIFTAGCASKSNARLKEQNAFLAGQNSVLMQQQSQAAAQSPGVTIVGAVQHPQVPWVTGLTLAQAIATANYVGANEPKQIIITRHGESAAMDANVLLNGSDIPLEIGDVIELR